MDSANTSSTESAPELVEVVPQSTEAANSSDAPASLEKAPPKTVTNRYNCPTQRLGRQNTRLAPNVSTSRIAVQSVRDWPAHKCVFIFL